MFQPEQTIQFRIYRNAQHLLGIATAEMMQIDYMTETISGSGIAGEYESPALGMTGPLSCKLSWISQTPSFYDVLNPMTPGLYDMRAALQRADLTTGIRKSVPFRVSLLGSVKSSGLGNLEPAKNMGNETELDVTRCLILLDGKEVLLIDKINMIHRVNGIDALSSVRADIGMDF